jgi:hypothetical protein
MCESNTAALCKSNGKERHGRGTVGERHGMCESALILSRKIVVVHGRASARARTHARLYSCVGLLLCITVYTARTQDKKCSSVHVSTNCITLYSHSISTNTCSKYNHLASHIIGCIFKGTSDITLRHIKHMLPTRRYTCVSRMLRA